MASCYPTRLWTVPLMAIYVSIVAEKEERSNARTEATSHQYSGCDLECALPLMNIPCSSPVYCYNDIGYFKIT
jgi:hypothetical protein